MKTFRKNLGWLLSVAGLGFLLMLPSSEVESAWTCQSGYSDVHYDHYECNANTACASGQCVSGYSLVCSDGVSYSYAKYTTITAYGTGCSVVEQFATCTLCGRVTCASGHMWDHFGGQCQAQKCAIIGAISNACTFDS
jgi:hypothetical protein